MTTNPTSSEKQILIEILKALSSGSSEGSGPTGPGVPTGGATGQILAKTSATDFDTEWIEPPAGGGGGADLQEIWMNAGI